MKSRVPLPEEDKWLRDHGLLSDYRCAHKGCTWHGEAMRAKPNRCPHCGSFDTIVQETRAQETPVAEGIRRRDDALRRVQANADPGWKDKALAAVRFVATAHERFSTDHVWAQLQLTPEPHERRALGAVMRHAAGMGLIEPTSEWTFSLRPECHRRPVRIWRRSVAQGVEP